MYIIDIVVSDSLSAEQHETLFAQHADWFKKYAQAGNFLMLGPYRDQARAGVIFATADSRAELDAILAEDCYYPDLAEYRIRDFEPKMISPKIGEFVGK